MYLPSPPTTKTIYKCFAVSNVNDVDELNKLYENGWKYINSTAKYGADSENPILFTLSKIVHLKQ